MENSIIAGDDSGNFVRVPKDVSPDGQLSFRLVQEVYSLIHRGQERLQKIYRRPYLFAHADFIQLGHLLDQLFEQYQVVSCERTFSLIYSKGRKDSFSDWQRLKIFDTNQTTVVKKVVISVKALLLLPQSKEPRSYEVQIEFDSLITRIKTPKELVDPVSGEDEDEEGPPAWWILRQQGAARVLISYSDYIVATTLSTAIENWFKLLKVAPGIELSKNIRSYLGYSVVSNFPYFITGGMGVFACDRIFDLYTSSNWTHAKLSVSLTILLFVALLVFKIIDGVIDKFSEYVFSLEPVSAIRMTKGDENLYAALQTQNRRNLIGGAVTLIGAIVVGVLGNATYELLIKKLFV